MTGKRQTQPTDVVRAAMPGEFIAAEAGAPAGTVKALVSAYGVKYRIGFARYHTIEPGAFAASIADQDAIPLFWMHGWDWTEQMPTGSATASEESAGLEIDGRHYVDLDPEVARLHQSMVDGAIREWSIGYRVLAYRVDPDDEAHWIVTEAELLEASAVLRGANPQTGTLEAASAPGALEAGEVLLPAGATMTLADGTKITAAGATPAEQTAPPAPPAPSPGDAAGELTDDDLAGRFALLGRDGVREAFAGAVGETDTPATA